MTETLMLLRGFPRVWSPPELLLELSFDSSAKLCAPAADRHRPHVSSFETKVRWIPNFLAFTFHTGRTDGLKK